MQKGEVGIEDVGGLKKKNIIHFQPRMPNTVHPVDRDTFPLLGANKRCLPSSNNEQPNINMDVPRGCA